MTETATRSPRVVRFALATLIVNLFVIVWGAWVRASGSGAGCGNHWPTCNGEVIPQSPTLHTIVEFTHRASSGLAVLLIVALVVVTWRRFAPSHLARKAAILSFVLICVEAGIGAGLVKFELVAGNASIARALSLGIHLVNTQFLLAALALTAWGAEGRDAPALRTLGTRGWWFAVAMMALVLVGMTGAVASLGDTLFPARTLTEGLAQDRDPASHLLLRLRVWHPIMALLTGTGLLFLARAAARWRPDASTQRASRAVMMMVLVQWTVGVSALILLVPVPLQLLHVTTADLLWLSVVWLSAAALSPQAGLTTPASSFAASASNTVPAPSSR